MKTKLFIIASLLFTALSANATLVVENSVNEQNTVLPSSLTNECTDPDCMFFAEPNYTNNCIFMEKRQDITVRTENGTTIYKGEDVKMLDCSNWANGNYTVISDGIEKLTFSIEK